MMPAKFPLGRAIAHDEYIAPLLTILYFTITAFRAIELISLRYLDAFMDAFDARQAGLMMS